MTTITNSVVKPIYTNTYLPSNVRIALCEYRLWVQTESGWWYHPTQSVNRVGMAKFHANVVAKGEIDTELWIKHGVHTEVKAPKKRVRKAKAA
jgi:hypothetical protein